MSWQEEYVARYEARLREKWTADGQQISDVPMMRYDGKVGVSSSWEWREPEYMYDQYLQKTNKDNYSTE